MIEEPQQVMCILVGSNMGVLTMSCSRYHPVLFRLASSLIQAFCRRQGNLIIGTDNKQDRARRDSLEVVYRTDGIHVDTRMANSPDRRQSTQRSPSAELIRSPFRFERGLGTLYNDRGETLVDCGDQCDHRSAHGKADSTD